MRIIIRDDTFVAMITFIKNKRGVNMNNNIDLRKGIRTGINKIAAIGVGVVMLGATLLGAGAQDLTEFPSPFVDDGNFNSKIVVGENALIPDVIGAIDISARLQYDMRSPTGENGEEVVISGDSEQIRTPTDILEFGEQLGEVKEVFTYSDLDALSGSNLRNSKGTFEYSQNIELPETQGLMVSYAENQDDETDIYMMISNNQELYTYSLDFSVPLESDIDGSELEDLNEEEIMILGKTYTISSTEVDTGSNSLTIELLGGEISDFLNQGESGTYEIDDTEYEVEVRFIGESAGEDQVQFQVTYDGTTEITQTLAAGETYLLEDGTEVGIREILRQGAFAGEPDYVEFYMGADTITLSDDDYTDIADGSSLEVNQDSLNEVTVQIRADDSTSGQLDISGIEITALSPDDLFIPEGGMLSQELETDEAGILFTQNIDFSFEGITGRNPESVMIEDDSDDQYDLVFTNMAGNEITIPLWRAVSANGAIPGNDDGMLWTEQDADTTPYIETDDFFLVGDGTKQPDRRYTYLLQYEGYDSGDNEINIRNLGTDETLTYTLDEENQAQIILGGKQFTVNLTDPNTDDADIWVDLDGNGDADAVKMNATTSTGAWIEVPGVNPANPAQEQNSANLVIHMPPEKMDDELSYETITLGLDVSDSEVDLSTTIDSSGETLGLLQVGDSDLYRTYSYYGAIVEEDRSGNTDSLEIEIPSSQAEAQVFLTSGEVVVRTGDSAEGPYSISQIPAPVAVLDTEVDDIDDDNYIVVGGPCANNVAMELLGNPEPCREDFDEGQARIQLFEHANGNVAMLVAGYNGEDTRKAARVVYNYDEYPEFAGTFVEVSGTLANPELN